MCVGDGTPTGGSSLPMATVKANTYAAWPAMRGLGRYYALDVTCRGEADPQTGYFLNIKQIDHAVWEHVLPYLEDLIGSPAEHPADAPLGEVMRRMVELLDSPLDGNVHSLRLHLTPFYSLAIGTDDMSHVTLHNTYAFAAAHRLHVEELSPEQNREIFGKCNNPAGHGHNYQVEVAIRCPMDPAGHVLLPEELDQAVQTRVIDKLDHKHLNVDVPELKDLNPSVEHIAKVIWQMLMPVVGDLGPAEGTALEQVSVWETPKTRCVYRGE
jgi:6-pyruvoyltetrahydropterin/6-carboxytetrahydropterin synthase